MTSRAGLAIDVVIDSPLWQSVRGAEPLLRRAIRAAAPKSLNAELALVLADDAVIRSLNRRWRGRDEPTNVLSFPTKATGPPQALGDIIIAYETTAREAQAQGKPFLHHLAHLAVHGFLHLLGYDHELAGDAETMERLEREVLARLDVPDPYA